jgi:hypothetical protein
MEWWSQVGFEAWKGLKMMSRWWSYEENSRSFEVFVQKMLWCKNAIWEKKRIWSCMAACLGFTNVRKCPYIVCFTSTNQMLNWFSLSGVICTFAKLEINEYGGCSLPRFGLWPGCKQTKILLFCICLWFANKDWFLWVHLPNFQLWALHMEGVSLWSNGP